MPHRYEDMRPLEFIAARREAAVVYLPIGPLEWHGPHLPYGNDALKALALCERAAAQTGGVVLPPLFWGVGGVGAYEAYPGTTEIGARALGVLLADIFWQMRLNGFRVIVAFSGHAADAHIVELRRAGAEFQRAHGTAVLAVGDWELGGGHAYNADHAARWETSLLMALRPDLVRLDRLSSAYTDEDRRTLPWGVVRWRGEIFYQVHEGVWGEDPLQFSSAREGEELAGRIVTELTGRVRAALEEARDRLRGVSEAGPSPDA
jgi:creatinine amidohydrolase